LPFDPSLDYTKNQGILGGLLKGETREKRDEKVSLLYKLFVQYFIISFLFSNHQKMASKREKKEGHFWVIF